MSRKTQRHLRGPRGEAFVQRIRNVPFDRILCVSLDVSKYFHVVMIHNAYGEIVTPTFEIDIFRTGFEKLCAAIDEARQRTQAQVLLIGLEPTSHYFENLARHLRQRYGEVTFINSYSVKENRHQQMMHYEKDDEIDTAAIGDLLRRGEGTPFHPPQGVYLQLQRTDRARLAAVKVRTILKNRILGHLDRIFPGLVVQGKEAKKHCPPLFETDFWQCQTLQHLIRVCPDPHRLASMTPQQLVDAFHAQGYRLGQAYAEKIIHRAQETLLPDLEVVAVHLQLLAEDLALLEAVAACIAQREQREVALLAQTPGAILAQLKGISPVQAASFIAAMGDPAAYTDGAQVFRRTGLVSGRHDSGTRQKKGKGSRSTKVGDVYLRRAVMNLVDTVCLHQPVLRQALNRLKATKHPGIARVAVARRLVGQMWATMRDQRPVQLVLKRDVTM